MTKTEAMKLLRDNMATLIAKPKNKNLLIVSLLKALTSNLNL